MRRVRLLPQRSYQDAAQSPPPELDIGSGFPRTTRSSARSAVACQTCMTGAKQISIFPTNARQIGPVGRLVADVRPLRGVRFDAQSYRPDRFAHRSSLRRCRGAGERRRFQHSQDRKRRPRVRRRRPRPGRAALSDLAGAGCIAPRRGADDLRPPSSVRSGRHDGLANRVAGPGAPDRLVRAGCLASRADDARSQRGAPGSTAGGAGEPESTLFLVQGSRQRDPAI